MTTTHTGTRRRIPFSDLTFTGTREEVDELRTIAYHSGRLVYMSTPEQVSAEDPRLRIVIRLRSTR
jgi:hypothetical protein